MPIDLEKLKGQVYTPAEVTEILGVSGDSVRRIIRGGRLRAVHPFGGTTYLIHGEDLIRYLEGKPPLPSEPGE